jgi:hypothetical protein
VNDIKTPPTTMTPRIQGGGRAQGDEPAAEAEGVDGETRPYRIAEE